MAFVYCIPHYQHSVPLFYLSLVHCTHVLLISSKTMIDSRRHNSQISLLQSQTNPIITLTSNVKVTSTIEDISDFLVFVKMLVEEYFDLFLVVGQCGGRNGDFVAVLVVAGGGEVVNRVQGGTVVADDAEVGEVGGCDGAPAVVGKALVALWVVRGVRGGREGGALTSTLSYQYAFMIAIW
jgi:hypothetical protein